MPEGRWDTRLAAAWQEALALTRPNGALPDGGAVFSLVSLASLVRGERLTRLTRLNGRQQARTNGLLLSANRQRLPVGPAGWMPQAAAAAMGSRGGRRPI